MAQIEEWIKGISFSIFGALMYYYLWDNVFSNILDYVVGQDSILGAFAWISFVILYLFTVPIYLIYTGITGSSNEIKTKPSELLKAVTLWAVLMPVLTIIYQIIDVLITALNNSNVLDASMETTAEAFSWLLALIVVIALTVMPMYFILKGYGQIKEDSKK